MFKRSFITSLILCAAAAGTVAGCAKPNFTGNPAAAVQRDAALMETRLTTCARTHGLFTHSARRATLLCAFPKGDAAAIEAFALKTFSPSDLLSKSARDIWYQKIVNYALTQGPS